MKSYCVPESIKMFSSVLLAEEALRRGIKLRHINDYQEENALMELSYRKHFEYIWRSTSSQTSATANYIVKNKALTKDFLRRNGVQFTEGKLFLCKDVDAITEFSARIGYPLVIKKYNGTHGNLVFVGVNSCSEVVAILKKYFYKEKYVLVEKEFKGKEFRFLATREKVLGVAFREPANIIGDGEHTIKELITKKNQDPRRGLGYAKPLVKIKIDDYVREKLRVQKLDINSVIAKDRKIYLRNNSNISTGGDSIDVTDEVHSYLKKMAIKAVVSVPGLAYAGVDIMVKGDISRKPDKEDYAVLEINSSPGIFMHHFPFEGKPRDVAGEILDTLFPETKK